MNILVTGNLGYIGSVLTDKLIDIGYKVTGLDYNYFINCNLFKKKNKFKQIFRDIRNVKSRDLENIDIVIHLAALSNDPLGELNKKLTIDKIQ